jgi:replication factor C subunit 3/5
MRRILNLLQATSCAFEEVDETNLYLCSGDPLPADMTALFTAVMNETLSDTHNYISDLRKHKGYALTDLVTQLSRKVMATQFPPAVHIYLLEQLGELEHRLGSGTSDDLQVGSLAGLFTIARGMMAVSAS